MKSSPLIIVLASLAIVIIYIIYWFFSHFERVPRQVEVGYQGEARDNPFLAAQRLLERMGTTVKTVIHLPEITTDLDTQDTLVLLEYGSFLTDTETRQLLEWVDAGGHLIMVSEILHEKERTDEKDPLLTELRIHQYQNNLELTEIKQVSPTKVAWVPYHLQVAFNPNYYLEPTYYDPVKEISDEYGTHLLFYYFGTGMITVLSDMEFIENDQIGQYDHAQFLWLVIHFERSSETIWMVHPPIQELEIPEEKIPLLWEPLWRNMPTIIISILSLILFWLWLASRRFGPLLPPPPRARRRLLEHIEASGQFLWRQNQAAILLQNARLALLKHLELVHPDWMQLAQTELNQHLAKLTGLSAREIDKVLNPSQASKGAMKEMDTEFAFTRAIQILTQIRKQL